MKELVETLMKLQEYDNRLDVLQLQKGDLPALIENLENDLHEKKTKIEELGERIEKLQSDRRMFEKEVDASKAQLKKFEDQLYQVQNNKEYDAISLEIDTKKVEIENLENKIIQTLEDEEDLKKETTDLEEEIKQIEKQLADSKKELEEINQHTKEEESRLVGEREKVARRLDDRYLRRYERIRNAKNGIAVAPINRGSCGGCFSQLPPQLLVEVRKSDRIITCEFCGRILVWTED